MSGKVLLDCSLRLKKQNWINPVDLKSPLVQMTEAVYDISMEISPGGLDQLKNASVKLGILLERLNLDDTVAVMDEVSKVHSSPMNL